MAAGGILGEAGNDSSEFEKVINCYNAAALYETTGYNYDSNINAHTTGGHVYAGGIAGSCSYIENCYSNSIKIKAFISDGTCIAGNVGAVLTGGIVGKASQWPLNCYYYASENSNISGNYFGTTTYFKGAGTIADEFKPDDKDGNVFTYTISSFLANLLNTYKNDLNEELIQAGETPYYKGFIVENGTNDGHPIFERNYYLVTFHTENGMPIEGYEDLQFYEGEYLTPPEIDVEYGFRNVWINTVDGNSTTVDLFMPVTSDMSIKACSVPVDPEIITQPQSVNRDYDGTVSTLSAAATHPLTDSGYTLAYRWYKDNLIILSAFNNTYNVQNASDSGIYYCQIVIKKDYENSTIINTDAVEVIINKIKVEKPLPSKTEFVYDNLVHCPEISESDFYEISSCNNTYVGDYQLEIVLNDKDNYEWEDGTSENFIIDWSIVKADYDMSTIKWTDCKDFVYNGGVYTERILQNTLKSGLSVASYENNTATDAGTYLAKAYFTNTNGNYNTPEPLELTWQIKCKEVKLPSILNQGFIYNKQLHLQTIYSSNGCNITGTTSAINAGSYEIYASLNNTNYIWSDGTSAYKTYTWSIGKDTFYMSNVCWNYKYEYVYNNTERELLLINIDNDFTDAISLGEATLVYTNNTATKAGTYNARAVLTYDSDNYNEIQTNYECSWTINKCSYEKPCNPGNLVYNNKEQGVLFDKDANYEVRGTYNATVAGNYLAIFYFIDSFNYQWDDETVSQCNIDWSISKYSYDMSDAKWDYTSPFTYDGTERTITITGLPAKTELPNDLTVTYLNNVATNAGTLTASASFDYDDVNSELLANTIVDLNWTINHVIIDIPATPTGLIYNGEEQGLIVEESPLFTILYKTGVNANCYTSILSLTDKTNYKWSDETSLDQYINWEIEAVVIDMSKITWDYTEPLEYNGIMQEVVLKGLPFGVSVLYSENFNIEVGKYTAEVTGYIYDLNNYTLSDNATISPLNWEIKKGIIIKPEVNVNLVYNGEKQYIGIPEDTRYMVFGDSAKYPGTYEATITLFDLNYEWQDGTTEDIKIKYSIAKASYTDNITHPSLSGEYRFDKTLFDYELQDGFSWVDWNEVPTAGIKEYAAVYNDDIYYNDYNLFISLDISKCVIDFSFDVPEIMLEGNEYQITVTLNTLVGEDIVTFTIEGNKNSEAGEYTATVTAVDNDNYCLPENCSINYTIDSVDYEEETVEVDTKDEITGEDKDVSDGCAGSIFYNGETIFIIALSMIFIFVKTKKKIKQ